VLLSQAPHHAGNPAQALQAAFLILKPGGRVVVLDLLADQFEKARELHADPWLGFTEAALLGLLEEAGFKKAEVAVVSRNEANPVFQTLLAIGFRAGSNGRNLPSEVLPHHRAGPRSGCTQALSISPFSAGSFFNRSDRTTARTYHSSPRKVCIARVPSTEESSAPTSSP
jgi:hypothetical protein